MPTLLLTYLLTITTLTALTGLTLLTLTLATLTLLTPIPPTLTWCGYKLPLTKPTWAWYFGTQPQTPTH